MTGRLLGLVVLLLLGGCEKGSDEQQIRAAVAELTASIEAFDAGDLEQRLHPSFSGNRKLGRQEAKRLLLFYRLRKQPVSVGSKRAISGCCGNSTGNSPFFSTLLI